MKIFKIILLPILFLSFFNSQSFADTAELQEIKNAINRQNGKWTANETSISKLASDERQKRLGTIIPPKGTEKVLTIPSVALPVRLDWRNFAGYNYVTPVKEQGTCAACWAFAPTAALESSILISQNIPLNTSEISLDLSEQTAVSCSEAGTCRGGSIDYASDFIRYTGLPQENCFPYIAAEGFCLNACPDWQYNAYKISDWYRVEPNIQAIKYALYNHGPIVATMSVYTDFLYYKSGIYSYAWGNLEGYHSALIVGYDDVEKYFIVKSSWGIDWGESGFFRIAYSELNGIASFGYWTIAYDYAIPTDFPIIDNISRNYTNSSGNTNAEDKNKGQDSNNNHSTYKTVFLNGTVRNQSGSPVAGVNIKIRDYYATTNTNGQFNIAIPTIPSGNYVAILRKDGYSTAIEHIILPPLSVVTKDFIIVQSASDNRPVQPPVQVPEQNPAPKANKQPQIAGPGWFMAEAEPVSVKEADKYYSSKKVRTGNNLANLSYAPMTGLATDISSEITELARGLQYDPMLIYEYVYNNIDYVPYFGSHKGATLTYLDKAGNDFDHASLAIALLRASGYTAKYLYVLVNYPAADLANWLGVDPTQQTISSVLASGSIPHTSYSDGSADVVRVVVLVNINGTDYYFDPAFKVYAYTNKIDIVTAMGYSQSDLLTAAQSGATVTADYAQNMNETGLRNKLVTYSSNLVNTIRSQYPNSDVKEIIGGRSISGYKLTTPLGMYATWDEIPAAYIATLRIQHVGIDYTFSMADLSGKRLTLTYSGGVPELRLDGGLIASGTATTLGSKNNLTLTIDHPYAAPCNPTCQGTYADQSVTYSVQSGSSYAIVYDFGRTTDALLMKRQRQLDIYKAQGLVDASESVLGETLNIMGLTWLKEVGLSNRLLSSIADTASFYHHNVGLMAQEAGYYIDVKAGFISVRSKHNNANSDTDRWAHFKTQALILSAFEHGMLEQLMGSDNPAVSTMKLFQIANSTGRKIFAVNSGNYAAIQPQLVNYLSAELTDFQNKLNSGYTLILPDNGQLVSGQWRGEGYITKKFDATSGEMGMIIGGGYYGGYSSSQEWISIPTVFDANLYTLSNAEVEFSNVYNQISIIQPIASIEPVDMAGGNYVYDSTDLALGAGAPLGLSFSRSYNSGVNQTNRTLGYGWTHNYDITISPTSDGNPGLGMRQPVDAASFIAAAYAILDLMKNQDNIQGWLTASLSSKWAVDTLIDNAVAVKLGGKNMEYIKLADGTYAAPPGITTQLIKNGDGTYSLKERFGTQLNFNPNKQISSLSDIDGNTMTFAYSGNNLTTITDGFGRTFSLQYDGNNMISRVSDPTGRYVLYSYDANKNLTAYTDAENKTWTYGYDSNHRMTTLTNVLGTTTATNVYDTLGRVKTQTVPRQTGSATYNFYFSGYRNAEQDPDGKTIVYYYDSKGRSIKQVDALGNAFTKTYDGQDHTTNITDPRNYSTTFTYDGNQNLITTTNALLQTSTNIYDSQYRLISTTDPLLHTTQFAYDTEHHLISTTNALGNTASATYYPNGYKQTTTNPKGTVTTSTYQSYGNPLSAQTSSHPAITYGYDAVGRMTSLTDQVGSKTSFTYDKRGLLTTKTDPLARTSTYSYDNAGRLTSKTDRNGSTINYTYTPTDKLTTIAYPDSTGVALTYNQHDRLVQMNDSLGATSYVYDAAGRLTSMTNPYGFAISYAYDAAGNITSITYPGNKIVNYTYDRLNRIRTIKNWLNQTATYAYDAAGRLAMFRNFNGIVTTYAYDNANRLTRINIVPNIASYAFTLDANGNRTGITQTEPLTMPIPASSNTAYTYNTPKNRLLTAGTSTFGYDNEGQLSSGYGKNYGFDYEHRLTGTSTDAYYYDGAGNRLRAVRNGVETRYIYDAAGNLLAEADGNNNITKYYVYGLGLIAMVTPSNAVYSYHYNATGSTIAMTDINKNIVNAYQYDPFGNIANQSETVTQPFKFVGQFGVMTEPNGFYYMRARYYDPNVGRFISEDPIGFEGGDTNLMAYVFNNPTNLVDPDGQCPLCAFIAVKAGAIAVAYTGTKIAQWTTNYFAGNNAVSNESVNDAFKGVAAVNAAEVGAMAIATGGYAAARAATTLAITNPQLSYKAAEFIEGFVSPGPPSTPSWSNYWGSVAGGAYQYLNESTRSSSSK